MISRQKTSIFENVQVLGCNSVTMGIQLENPRYVPDIVEKFKKEIISLNLRYENGYFYKRSKEIRVRELPKVDDLRSLTNYVMYHSRPNYSEECGEIYVSNDTIILRMIHSLADGKYLVGILDHISDKPKELENPFPVDFQSTFSKELFERRKQPQTYIEELDLYSRLTKRFGKMGGPELVGEIIFDVQSFMNYDKKTKKCKNITPSITTGYSLGILALEGLRNDNIYKIGGPMVVDMRPEMKTKPTLNTTNMYSIVPSGSVFNGDETIGNVLNKLRMKVKEPFVEKMKLFDSPDSIINPRENIPERKDILGFFSQLGMVKIKSPIRDVIIYDKNYNNILNNATHIISYQVVDDRNDRNEFHYFHRYNTNGINGWQSRLLLHSLKHFLQTFDERMTITEALKDMQKFQKQFCEI